MGRELGRGFRMGKTCKSMVDSCQCMAKPPQYCKVISFQLKKKKKKTEPQEPSRPYPRRGLPRCRDTVL